MVISECKPTEIDNECGKMSEPTKIDNECGKMSEPTEIDNECGKMSENNCTGYVSSKARLISYQQRLDEIKQLSPALLEGNPQSNGWVYNSRSSDVDIYTQQRGDDLYSMGIGEIAVPPGVARQVFAGIHHRFKWDRMLKEGRVVEDINPFTSVLYSRLKRIWPVAGRDLLMVGCREDLPDGSIRSYAASIEHDQVPVHKECVRATLVLNAVKFEPLLGGKHCRITSVTISDPGGSIPGFIVKLINTQIPLVINKVRKLLAEDPDVRKVAAQEEEDYKLRMKNYVLEDKELS